jgi:hypothetical protein
MLHRETDPLVSPLDSMALLAFAECSTMSMEGIRRDWVILRDSARLSAAFSSQTGSAVHAVHVVGTVGGPKPPGRNALAVLVEHFVEIELEGGRRGLPPRPSSGHGRGSNCSRLRSSMESELRRRAGHHRSPKLINIIGEPLTCGVREELPVSHTTVRQLAISL